MKKILKQIYHLFFLKSGNTYNELDFVKKGDNVSIANSAILSAASNGFIIFEGNNYIGNDVEISASDLISIGQNASIQHRCILLGDIEIGANSLFADNVYISSGRHNFDLIPEMCIKDQDEYVQQNADLSIRYSKKVIIGEDCWLGTNCVIMSGVTIGKGSIVGANSVVTKDVAPYSIVGGIPSKTIKSRLEFIPPTSLNYNENADLPYFYKGFFVRKVDLEKDRMEGGITCGKTFVVALENKITCKTIKIEFKKKIINPIDILFQEQRKKIDTNEWSIIEFEIKDLTNFIFTFDMESLTLNHIPHKVLLIKSILIA